MKKIGYGLLLLSTVGVQAESLSNAFSSTTVDGYLRGAYQSHDVKDDKTYKDDALGGKLHIETGAYYGFSVGASAYSSNAIKNHDNKGLVPFRGDEKSYTILGEAYLKAEFGNSMFKVGRQEIETPFAEVDDIGMTPNSFEAAIFENKDIENTRIFLGHIQRMAGVDAEIVDDFTNVNGSEHMQILGVTYEGIKNIDMAGWYYRLKDAEIESIAYLEANYKEERGDTIFEIGVQYSNQGYRVGKDAHVYGGTFSAMDKNSGLTLSAAYTKAQDNAATSGFGGGPFYSNSEYLIIDNAGANGKALWYGAEYDASYMGVEGLTIGYGQVTQTTATGAEATEKDIVASYEMSENFELRGIYSTLKGRNVGEDEAKHLRVFGNYSF